MRVDYICDTEIMFRIIEFVCWTVALLGVYTSPQFVLRSQPPGLIEPTTESPRICNNPLEMSESRLK